MQLYRSFDHRLPDNTFPTEAARNAWRQSNTLVPTQNEPFVTYPIDAMMSASLGFVANSALEAVMTTAIRQVRLCRFKQFCHLPGISVAVAGAQPCTWANVIDTPTHSPLANWARNPTLDGQPKGCAETGATVSCAVTVKQTEVPISELTCDRMRWEDFAIKEAQTYMGSSVFQSAFLDNIQGGIGKSLALATLVQAFDPTIEALMLVDHGATTTLAESIYGNCEKNVEDAGSETVVDSTGFYNDITLHHLFPKAPSSGSSTGACTCKGQRAYEFSKDGGANYPYRNAANRKVIYDTTYFSNSDTDEASLHKCTWMSPPQHSTSNTPLNSVDQFTMSLEFLKRGEGYFFEMNAVQFDHQAFSDANLNNNNVDQFSLGATTARRLLASDKHTKDHAHTTQVTGTPRAALKQLARKKISTKKPARKLLSTMLPVADTLTTTAVMPQGPLKIQGADASGSFASQSTGGFVVQGEAMEHTLNRTAIAQDMNKEGSSLSDIYRWIERGSGEGISQSIETIKIALSSDTFDWTGRLWSQERWRASIGVGPWVGVLLLLIEIAISYLLPMAATHSRRSGVLFGKRETGKTANAQKESKTIFTYSRSFFESPRQSVNFADGQGTFASAFGLLLNEASLVLAGYYFLAVLMIPAGLALLVVFALEHFIRCTKPNQKGRYPLRYRLMRIVSTIMDKSATEEIMTLIFGSCGGEEMRTRLSYICDLKSWPFWVGKLIQVFGIGLLRFLMACMALFLLPMSLMAYPIYMALTFIGRRCLFKGIGKSKDEIYFLGNREKSAIIPFFPWDLRGAGYGYLEFGDFEEGTGLDTPDLSKAEQGGDRYKARATENRERQSLIESSNAKPTNGFSNIV
jgi:hypothetical protein